MKIYYQVKEKGIEIIRCFENDSNLVLPELIENIPVVAIAPYAFSTRGEEVVQEYRTYETKELFSKESKANVAAGESLEKVVFPNTVMEIGRYAFYGCKNLKTLEFSNALTDIGSGAFTGCTDLSELYVHMQGGDKSCVKEILGELWQQIQLTFFYEQEKSKASLLFPEHYEEAVENTPARLLYTQHHGSGNDYRQCFYNREMDYEKYDSLILIAVARDSAPVFADIICGRLAHPYKLSSANKATYIEIIRQQYAEVLEYLIREEKVDFLQLFSSQSMWKEEMLACALELVAKYKKTELTGWLMQEQQRWFPTRQKKFLL